MTNAEDALSRIQLPDAPADQSDILSRNGVACWNEAVTIDTYAPAAPDRYPLYLDRRVYQGSSGRVYPMPFTDRISREKEPRVWQAIHLENEYVRLMILPEIGGRIHIGIDKTNGYDFFYRNNVIKPALVGLAGPWISGGVEFNWPQHHRPATFLPVESTIERTDDGAATVWLSDIDPLQRMRATYGIRLRPGRSLVELDVRLHNRTDEPQTFLWWANVAARSHEEYQSFFPGDVGYVADHARRAVTAFPRADRPYYGVDYPALVDDEHPDADRIDVYSNIPVPTSYMITDTKEDFFGGYDHSARAGFVHWADRRISPGKKQWTWGNGPVGHAWDALLTDADGPYVELMAGVYTDNQPDFSYLAPGETRLFSQYWYPVREIGPARRASRETAVGLERFDSEGESRIRIGVSSVVRRDATVLLEAGTGTRGSWKVVIAPDRPFTVDVPADADEALTVRVRGEDGDLLVWSESVSAEPAEPWMATVPAAPADIDSVDELYLTAVHLAQYRHPTRSAVPYLEEVLRRDPSDSRAALALGAWHFHRGQYDDAEECFRRALGRLTRRNLNPRSGEASYRLGLVLERTGRREEAADRYAKACWDAAWALPGELALARLALRRGEAGLALSHAEAARRLDAVGPQARHLIVLSLRALGRDAEAGSELAAILEEDPLDPVAAALAGNLKTADPKTPLLVAVELARAGQWRAALDLTGAIPAGTAPSDLAFGNPGPLGHYLRALWLEELGDRASAQAERRAARSVSSRYAFPAGLDEYDALVAAVAADPEDAVAPALLGAWYLDVARTVDAQDILLSATDAGSIDPVAWRNAAVATVNAGGDLERAAVLLDTAQKLGPEDARLVFESDLLAELRGVPARARLAAIEARSWAADERDDVALRRVHLLLDLDLVDEALDIMLTRVFQPFEGGEGKAIAAYDRAVIAAARRTLRADPEGAVALLGGGFDAPPHLGEGRHPGVPMAERFVLWGDAKALLGRRDEAVDAWQRALRGPGPVAVDPVPVSRETYWVGVAAIRLGLPSEAEGIWRALEERADELDGDRPAVDYFATSLPELLLFDLDTREARRAEAADLRGLAGQGRSLLAVESSMPTASYAMGKPVGSP